MFICRIKKKFELNTIKNKIDTNNFMATKSKRNTLLPK